jgi:hypothetical protein
MMSITIIFNTDIIYILSHGRWMAIEAVFDKVLKSKHVCSLEKI